MVRNFLVLAVGAARSHGFRHFAERPLEAIGRRIRAAVFLFDQDRKPSLALHQSARGAGVAGALDQVAIPVAEQLESQDGGRALNDGRHSNDPATPVFASPARAAQLAALTQPRDKLLTDFTARQDVDRSVKRLVRDTTDEVRHRRKSAGYLLRRPSLSDVCGHVPAQRRTLAQFDKAAEAAERGPPGVDGVIAPRLAAMARHVCGDRQSQTPQCRRDSATAAILDQTPVNEFLLNRVEAPISLSHGNTR